MSSSKIDIVIPVYNEAGNIGPAIRAIQSEVKENHQINIIYDFDEDNSLPEAKQTAAELGIQIQFVKNSFGRGALGAIKTGLQVATAPLVVVTMADLSDPPSVINEMYRVATEQNADIVCASRYMAGGQQIGGPAFKAFLSKMAGLSLYWIAGIPTRDATNSFKLYRKKVLDAIPIESTGGFEVGMEIVVKAHALGYKIAEVPTTWRDRSNGKSNFKLWKWLPLYLRWQLLAFKNRTLRWKI